MRFGNSTVDSPQPAMRGRSLVVRLRRAHSSPMVLFGCTVRTRLPIISCDYSNTALTGGGRFRFNGRYSSIEFLSTTACCLRKGTGKTGRSRFSIRPEVFWWMRIHEAALIDVLFLAGFKPGGCELYGPAHAFCLRRLLLPLCFVEERTTRLDYTILD